MTRLQSGGASDDRQRRLTDESRPERRQSRPGRLTSPGSGPPGDGNFRPLRNAAPRRKGKKWELFVSRSGSIGRPAEREKLGLEGPARVDSARNGAKIGPIARIRPSEILENARPYLEEAQDVGHHDRLGREARPDHARDGLVRHVARRLARLALVFRRVLQGETEKEMRRAAAPAHRLFIETVRPPPFERRPDKTALESGSIHCLCDRLEQCAPLGRMLTRARLNADRVSAPERGARDSAADVGTIDGRLSSEPTAIDPGAADSLPKSVPRAR